MSQNNVQVKSVAHWNKEDIYPLEADPFICESKHKGLIINKR